MKTSSQECQEEIAASKMARAMQAIFYLKMRMGKTLCVSRMRIIFASELVYSEMNMKYVRYQKE